MGVIVGASWYTEGVYQFILSSTEGIRFDPVGVIVGERWYAEGVYQFKTCYSVVWIVICQQKGN